VALFVLLCMLSADECATHGHGSRAQLHNCTDHLNEHVSRVAGNLQEYAEVVACGPRNPFSSEEYDERALLWFVIISIFLSDQVVILGSSVNIDTANLCRREIMQGRSLAPKRRMSGGLRTPSPTLDGWRARCC